MADLLEIEIIHTKFAVLDLDFLVDERCVSSGATVKCEISEDLKGITNPSISVRSSTVITIPSLFAEEFWSR